MPKGIHADGLRLKLSIKNINIQNYLHACIKITHVQIILKTQSKVL